jgi:hypothetical protein
MSRLKKDASKRRQALVNLRAGVATFNDWRHHFPSIQPLLDNEDLRGLSLIKANFAILKLKASDLSGCDLTGASFAGANLNSAKLVAATLTGADFSQARLANADFTGADLNGANLHETIRDGWILKDVRCSYCWITKDRDLHRDTPDRFEDGEFALTYGGRSVKVVLPGGFQPIDLIALPFHAERVLREFPGQHLVFAGISTIGEPTIEFKVEPGQAGPASEDVQELFRRVAPLIRDEVSAQLGRVLGDHGSGAPAASFSNSVQRLLSEKVDGEARSGRPLTVQISNFVVGDTIVHNSGVLGSVATGGASSTTNVTLTGLDPNVLVAELRVLHDSLRSLATTVDEHAAVMAVQAAAKNVQLGNASTAIQQLKKAGKWALNTATTIGVSVAAEALKRTLFGDGGTAR